MTENDKARLIPIRQYAWDGANDVDTKFLLRLIDELECEIKSLEKDYSRLQERIVGGL